MKTRYETNDGDLFDTEEEALQHEQDLELQKDLSKTTVHYMSGSTFRIMMAIIRARYVLLPKPTEVETEEIEQNDREILMNENKEQMSAMAVHSAVQELVEKLDKECAHVYKPYANLRERFTEMRCIYCDKVQE